VAQEFGPQAGPSALGPRGRCARLPLPQVVTDGRVPLVRLPLLSSLRDAEGKVPPVSFSFNTHGGSATTPAAGGEGLSPRARAHQHRLTFATSLLSPNRALPSPGASTSRGDAVGKQLRGGEVRARRCTQQLCPGGRASPLLNTVASHIHWNPVLWFCKFRPKFELKTKFHQNESCAKFYKLQIIFWCPKLILSGRV
jgi:hypothetical protein